MHAYTPFAISAELRAETPHRGAQDMRLRAFICYSLNVQSPHRWMQRVCLLQSGRLRSRAGAHDSC